MKPTLIIALFLVPTFSMAQFNKGQLFLGGSISASTVNSNAPIVFGNAYPTKSTTFSITPTIGRFVSSKLAWGGSIGYSTSSYQTDYPNSNIINGVYTYSVLTSKSVSNSLLVNSFVQYYVPLTSSFYFTLQGQLNFARTANDQTSPQYNGNNYVEITKHSPSYGIGATIRPSFIFFPAPQWGIEAGIGYLSYTRTRYLPDVYSSNNLSFNAGSFSLGLSYYFGDNAK